MNHVPDAILAGDTALGIELGSTRIKAVLVGPDYVPLATGVFEWSSRVIDGYWSYPLEEVWSGVQAAYADLTRNVRQAHGVELSHIGALGFSAMMCGYLPFDADGELLAPFRTWQNTTTARAAAELTQAFQYHVPQRWTLAHLHQAVLDGEPHVHRLDYLPTLAAYVHWRVTGERVIGIGDASALFPIDVTAGGYDSTLLTQFDELISDRGYPWRTENLLPRILTAGEIGGTLTSEGALLLDPTGVLQPGCPVAPPEGDAGTGMVATNCVALRTANVSAGTSIFAMVVLDEPLQGLHEEVDLVTTPAGDLVGMAHSNNGAIDLNAWVSLFGEAVEALGVSVDGAKLFETLYGAALDGDPDGGGMLAYNYLAGEHMTGIEEGRPLFLRSAASSFNLPNFMRTHLYAALGALRVGVDVLRSEGMHIDRMFAHGGLFKTKGVAQRLLAGAMDTPVSVGDVAGEGGAWGMALLALFMKEGGGSLAEWLDSAVFRAAQMETVEPDPIDVEGFDRFMVRYRAGLEIERAAVRHFQ